MIKRPEFRLSLPKPVVEHDYILISVEDQIADKAAAMMDDRYAGGVGSSRAKDLVDIALLALNEAIDADLLRLAVVSETERRGLKPYGRLVATVTIQKDFHRVASKATAFPNHVDWQEAEDLGNALLMPVLARTVTESTWDPVIKAWRQNS